MRRSFGLWPAFAAGLSILYAAAFYYLALGFPGVPPPRAANYHFWREATPVVRTLRDETARRFGRDPVVVGMTKWSITSVLEFYDDREALGVVGARHFFACSASMYEYWVDPESAVGRPLLLISQNRGLLSAPWIDSRLEGAGPVSERLVVRHGAPLRTVYYRVAERYLGVHDPRGVDPPLFECGTTAPESGAAPNPQPGQASE